MLIVGRIVVALVGLAIGLFSALLGVASLMGPGPLTIVTVLLAVAALVGAIAGARGRAWGAVLVAVASGVWSVLVVGSELQTPPVNPLAFLLPAVTVLVLVIAWALWRARRR